MIKPLVSILIPVYNRDKLIGACIQSALEQTLTDIEVIVIDNASTDETWSVCQAYAQKDSRVRIFRNNQNIGPVRNWQHCILEARGKYGKILFSDDLIDRKYLEKTVPILDDPYVGFVFTKACIGEQEWQGNIHYEYFNINKFINTDQYLKDCILAGSLPVSPGCALFRIDDLRNNLRITIPSTTVKDFDNHGAGPDLLLYLLTAVSYKKVAYINETLAFFRSHPGSITVSDKSRYLQKCYLQAKVWFVAHYRPQLLNELLIISWISEIKTQRRIVEYRNFINQYLNSNTKKLDLRIVGKVLGNFIVKKIFK